MFWIYWFDHTYMHWLITIIAYLVCALIWFLWATKDHGHGLFDLSKWFYLLWSLAWPFCLYIYFADSVSSRRARRKR